MNQTTLKIGIAGQTGNTANYEKACRNVGFLPITTLSIQELSTCDALILPGGADITPGYYGQANHGSRSIDTALDLLQFQALDLFVHHKKPVLGICKGMQVINVYFGGTLIQHLPTHTLHQAAESDVFHTSRVTTDCLLKRLYGTEFIINSNHHQAVDRLGKHLIPIQYSEDHVLEAFMHDSLPILGVQWHPERLFPTSGEYQKEAPVSGNLLLLSFLAG